MCSNYLTFARNFIAKLQKMVKIFLVSVLIIAIAVALLSVRVILLKGGTMKSQHIKDNEYLKSKGIHCVLDQDREARNDVRNK